MSVSREWNSLKAAWLILLVVLIARIFFSNQFLLTPDEAVYWQMSQYPSPSDPGHSPLLTWLIGLSTSLFGNSETAVRLPAILSLTLAAIYMARLGASMFSWHTAMHITLLSQGILQLNLAALVLSPYSLLLPCWTAVCYHSSEAMHDNRTGQWLFAGFWFGVGLICHFSMVLLLPCIILCFILIKPFRTCLLFPGPWLALLLSLGIFLPATIWHENTTLLSLIDQVVLKDMANDLIPDGAYSLQFIVDHAVLLTPVVLLLIATAWLTGSSKRHLVRPDVQFLTLTSLPLFLLFLVFPVFADSGTAWSAIACITAIILVAGIHSSTRSSFKGRPDLWWKLGVTTAYCITVPLIVQIAFPFFPQQLNPSQTRIAGSGWNLLGTEVHKSILQMPNLENTFIFSMEPKIASELAFYVPGNPRTISLDHRTRTNHKEFLEKNMRLVGQDGLGLVSTRTALDQAKLLFDRVELEREITLNMTSSGSTDQGRTFYMIHGFGFKSR